MLKKKGKKSPFLLTALCLALALLAGCGQTGGGEAAPPETAAGGTAAIETFKTIGDAPALGTGANEQYATIDNYFVYVFELDGTNYRVITSMPEDVAEAVWDLDWADEDHDAKLQELVSPLVIERYENLDEQILPQDELDAWTGKTGQDLFDDGWTNSGWDLETMEFWMDKGPFTYTVAFDGQVDDYEAFQEEDIGPLVIKSVSFARLGNATDLVLDENGKIVE